MSEFKWQRLALPVVGLVIALVIAFFTIDNNDMGERTVLQYPWGAQTVKFQPGVFFRCFGKTWVYPDYIKFDFDLQSSKDDNLILDQKGITVRYQDGGRGDVYSNALFGLPKVEQEMLNLHKAYQSKEGVAFNLIKTITEETMNLTAGLMRSEEAYATKRGMFTEMAKSQIRKGPFRTTIKVITQKDEATGKVITNEIPEVEMVNGQPTHIKSALQDFGVTLAALQLNDPGFEEKTLKQIDDKRSATMAIITAKATAEKAKQDAITAEENGKAEKVKARYEEEVKKERAVVLAQQQKEVATISAKQKVEVARQAFLEAKEMKNRAKEIKEANILEGQGLAEKKRLIMQADGALAQKLEAFMTVNRIYAKEFGKQKWVPEIQFGESKGGSNAAMDLIQMMTVNQAKALGLNLDMKVTK